MGSKRSIFEEVSGDDKLDRAAPGAIDRGPRGAGAGARGAIRLWLMLLFGLVVVMVVVGGLTRLMDGGLSITGVLPPMSQADWQAEFDRYKQIDQWQIQNQWMQLADFKVIYWWEWGHRQLGRVIGLVWAIGFFGFLVARRIPPGWTGRLLFLGLLCGAQGAIGWWTVTSGITQGEGMTSVASYWLAVHLGLAFAILGFIAWYIFELGRSGRDLMQARRAKEARLFGLSTGLLHFAFLQILLGALVAGIDAGRSFADWPLMGGQVLPPGAFALEPVWRNLFEHPGLVQFIHRVTGYLLVVFAGVVWLRGRKSAHATTRRAFDAMIFAMLMQLGLGIFTVLTGSPWAMAIVHQLLVVVLFVLILRARFLAAYPRATSLKGNAT